MATAARKAPVRAKKAPAASKPKVQAEAPASAPSVVKDDSAAEPAAKAKPAKDKPAKTKRIRGSFSMPEADHARIAKLKATARRNGVKVKKNELLRLGLRALQTLTGPELHAAVLALRVPGPARAKRK